MSPGARAPFSVVASEPSGAVARLHRHVGRREGLREAFRRHWQVLAPACTDQELEAWCETALALADVNAGPACLEALARYSAGAAPAHGAQAAIRGGEAAAEICRRTGTRPAQLCLEQGLVAARRLHTPRDLDQWWTGLVLLSRRAPESVAAAAGQTEAIVSRCDGAGFLSFVHAGLKATGRDRARRVAFFSLEDPLARQVLERDWDAVSFDSVERGVKAFATALWGRVPTLRSFETEAVGQMRRSSIAGGIVRVPFVYRSVSAEAAPHLFRAAVAHATAHLEFGAGRFPVGTLKPLQVALVTLVEDARIEALAMRRFPGLRRLWAPYHLAEPSNALTAPALLARLARALFDPGFHDTHGFVAKGRNLFAVESDDLENPTISRRIGGLLGNDLGQMRVQFNAKTYVVEPVYRDDGYGIWDFGEEGDQEPDEIEIFVDAARLVQEERPDEPDRERQDGEAEERDEGRARSAAPDDRGVIVARYPEWDRGAAVERQDWTTIRDVVPATADARGLAAALEARADLGAMISRLVRSARVGRHVRLRRQAEGAEIDLDAAIDAAISLRMGATPDTRIFRSSASRDRDLAVMVLVDVSESTRDEVAGGGTILDVERLAVALLAEAIDALDDRLALRAFASAGREDVKLLRIKEFDEPYGEAARQRLAGLVPGFSTRLGAALRHAGAELAPIRAHRKLLIVLTDGEPSDIDVADPQDLVEDARRAVSGVRLGGVDTFGLTLDPGGIGSGARIFGTSNHIPVRRIEELPQRLADLYFRLARA